MAAYEYMVAVLLFAAVAMNLYLPRMLALTFFSAMALLVIPNSIPSPDFLGDAWFPSLIAIEFSFACAALSTQTYAGKVIAAFSGLNSAVHALGWLAFHYDLSVYDQYGTIIRFGEISQLLALILFSGLADKIAQTSRDRKASQHDRNKLEYSSG